MKNNKTKKTNAQLFVGVALALVGVILMFLSFFEPPIGLIHPSVLTAMGEVFTFSGCLLGIDYHYKSKQNR